jgi:hypothetical protein
MQSSESSLFPGTFDYVDRKTHSRSSHWALRVHLLETTSRPVITLAKGFLVAGHWLASGVPPWIPSLGSDDCGLPRGLVSGSMDG